MTTKSKLVVQKHKLNAVEVITLVVSLAGALQGMVPSTHPANSLEWLRIIFGVICAVGLVLQRSPLLGAENKEETSEPKE